MAAIDDAVAAWMSQHPFFLPETDRPAPPSQNVLEIPQVGQTPETVIDPYTGRPSIDPYTGNPIPLPSLVRKPLDPLGSEYRQWQASQPRAVPDPNSIFYNQQRDLDPLWNQRQQPGMALNMPPRALSRTTTALDYANRAFQTGTGVANLPYELLTTGAEQALGKRVGDPTALILSLLLPHLIGDIKGIPRETGELPPGGEGTGPFDGGGGGGGPTRPTVSIGSGAPPHAPLQLVPGQLREGLTDEQIRDLQTRLPGYSSRTEELPMGSRYGKLAGKDKESAIRYNFVRDPEEIPGLPKQQPYYLPAPGEVSQVLPPAVTKEMMAAGEQNVLGVGFHAENNLVFARRITSAMPETEATGQGTVYRVYETRPIKFLNLAKDPFPPQVLDRIGQLLPESADMAGSRSWNMDLGSKPRQRWNTIWVKILKAYKEPAETTMARFTGNSPQSRAWQKAARQALQEDGYGGLLQKVPEKKLAEASMAARNVNHKIYWNPADFQIRAVDDWREIMVRRPNGGFRMVARRVSVPETVAVPDPPKTLDEFLRNIARPKKWIPRPPPPDTSAHLK